MLALVSIKDIISNLIAILQPKILNKSSRLYP